MGYGVVNRNSFRITKEDFASKLTKDKNRLKLVTEECLQIIKILSNKIGEVETTKYVEKEYREEGEYKEFGNNEYQNDLFFIRIRAESS
jgi:hypothetical protein